MANTLPNGVVERSNEDPGAGIAGLAVASSIRQTFRASSLAQQNQATPFAERGDNLYRTDEDITYRFNGTSWKLWNSPRKALIPAYDNWPNRGSSTVNLFASVSNGHGFFDLSIAVNGGATPEANWSPRIYVPTEYAHSGLADATPVGPARAVAGVSKDYGSTNVWVSTTNNLVSLVMYWQEQNAGQLIGEMSIVGSNRFAYDNNLRIYSSWNWALA